MNKGYAFLFSFLITGLIANNFFLFSHLNNQRETALISKVIDGDTFIINGGAKVRLLNVNTPEKNQYFYEESLSFLKNFENKTVQIEILQKDKYGRTLARVYTPDYLNLEIVKEGFATKFLVDKKESRLFEHAESQAIEQEKGMWKKSVYFGCVDSDIAPESEVITLTIYCLANFSDWKIKDESRKLFNLPTISSNTVKIHTFQGIDNGTDVFLDSKQNIWNNDKDTVYIFDSEWKIVYYKSYGY